MEALRCPPSEDARRGALGRRAAPRRPDPAAAHGARHPAPRRADQPPRRRAPSPGWSVTSRSTGARSSP
ncbi:MAG: hypothetical protein MZU84_08650 [Sphingobacterium sp.]|nr:hypothetical protein [Sphingobacterium sp.]